MPRIGFAYSVTHEATVFRGGYGIYFEPIGVPPGRDPDRVQPDHIRWWRP